MTLSEHESYVLVRGLPNLSRRQYGRVNCTWILTPDSMNFDSFGGFLVNVSPTFHKSVALQQIFCPTDFHFRKQTVNWVTKYTKTSRAAKSQRVSWLLQFRFFTLLPVFLGFLFSINRKFCNLLYIREPQISLV